MARQLILDTSLLIAYERQTIDRRAFDDDDMTIAAISFAEFQAGLEGAPVARRSRREAVRDAILSDLVVLDYTRGTAEAHARLLAHVKVIGRPRGAHDLIIAAHALETGRKIATLDRRARFADLPGVVVADLST